MIQVKYESYTESMSNKVTTRKAPRRQRPPRNAMFFPRELREAISDLHSGRDLELDSVNGQTSNMVFFGPLVQLKLVVKETGKLTGRFVIGMDLQPDAARELAATLTKLADVAQNAH
jgi:hypothetical protein